MSGYTRKRNNPMFEKDEDVLPFFSIHPRTKVGMILRIVLYAFLLIVCAITLLAGKANLVFYKYFDWYYLTYAVPIIICIALIIVALFKRMKRTITKILVPGVIGLIVISLALSVCTIMSVTFGMALSPAMILEQNDGNYMIMVTCVDPDGVEVKQDESGREYPEYPVRVDAYRYTGKQFADDACSISGEILIPQKATYEVKDEWIDENTLRFYIASDNSSLGTGEILIRFGSESENLASPGEIAVSRGRFDNADKSHSAALYREDSHIWTKTDSIYSLGKESFKQVYSVFPLKARYFIKMNVRTEGSIILEPYGTLSGIEVDYGSVENAIVYRPAEGSVGASGSITLYPGETVDLKLSGEEPQE